MLRCVPVSSDGALFHSICIYFCYLTFVMRYLLLVIQGIHKVSLVWRFVLIFWILLFWQARRSIPTIYTISIMIHKSTSNGAIEVIIRPTSSLAFNALYSTIRLPLRVNRLNWDNTCFLVLEIEIELALSIASVYHAFRFLLSFLFIAKGWTTILVSHLIKVSN